MTVAVPPYKDMLWPALQALIALGGSASIAELDAAVIDREQFSQEVQSVLHGDGPSTEVQYRLAWARTHLKGMGLITNSQRGVWTVTETGQSSTQDQFDSLNAAFVASRYKEKKSKSKGVKPSVASELADVEGKTNCWKLSSRCHQKRSSG